MEAIKTKVYRWSGMLKEMSTSHENAHSTFLTALPIDDNSLKKFIREALDADTEAMKIDVVSDFDADRIANKLPAIQLAHFK